MKNVTSSCPMTVWNRTTARSAAGEPVLGGAGGSPQWLQDGRAWQPISTASAPSPQQAPHGAAPPAPPAPWLQEHSSQPTAALGKARRAPGTHRQHQGQAGSRWTPAVACTWKSCWVWGLHQPPDQSPHLRPAWRNTITKTQPKLNSLSLLRAAAPCLLWGLQTEQFCRRKLLQRHS